MIRLIVGLGNPGLNYAHTPHNVGFETVEILADRWRGSFREDRRLRAALAELVVDEQPLTLLKPLTYMNLSGEAVGPFVRYRNIGLDEVLVICDDVNLPMGRVRLRSKGSHGGQKGLLSIIQTLGSNEFARLRIGIDPGKPVDDLTEYVLTPWWGQARQDMEIVCDRAADVVEHALRLGIAKTMAEYNGRDFLATDL